MRHEEHITSQQFYALDTLHAYPDYHQQKQLSTATQLILFSVPGYKIY
jgi:hypothetical protein